MTTVKSSPIENETTQFRTTMVNGKPQIYFDTLALTDETPAKTKSKQSINPSRLPDQQPKSKSVPSQKTTKPTKKTNKVTFNETAPTNGVFLTIDEIEELVQAVKENTAKTTNNPVNFAPPPPPPQPLPQQQPVKSVLEIPKNDVQPPLAPISPRQEALSLMAEKKRQKWLREKVEMDRMKLEVEYDQLKHQLSPTRQGNTSSDNKPPLPPTDNIQNQLAKTRLMERKQQQWKQENAEKAPVWNPFGRPGAGAPNTSEMQSKTLGNIVLNDQTHVPAAMRTNLLFGDVRFEDDVRTAKERERRQWLDDLQKQIEENKRYRFTQQETERRQDFLQDDVQPLIQEAAQRHQYQQQTTETSLTPAPTNNNNNTGQDAQRSSRHDSVVQQTYDKILEATELAKYEKKAQLIEKLKRNGHRTDLLAKTLPQNVKSSPSTVIVQKPPQDSSPKKTTTIATNTTTKIEPLQLNDTRRDEAVNTIDSTFRSETSVQTDLRIPQHKQLFTFIREESDLPPQIPTNLLRNTKPVKKTVRIRSHEDQQRQRHIQLKQISHDDSMTSQRSHTSGPIDIVHRPLWNYQNQKHREYVPNSKKYPPGARSTVHTTIIEEPSKQRTIDNRWYSDSEIQREQRERKPPTKINQSKEDTIVSLFKVQKPKQNTFIITKTDDISEFHVSSLDKYEHFTPYIRTDEVLDPAKAFSPVPLSRETSARRPRAPTITYDENHRRQNTTIQPAPYHVPPSRQDHILKQLTAIKENLVRRQQEVTTSMNAIPV